MLDGMRLIGLDPSHRIRLPNSVITILFSLIGLVGGNGASGKYFFSCFIELFNVFLNPLPILFFCFKLLAPSSLLEAVGVVAAVVAGAHSISPGAGILRRSCFREYIVIDDPDVPDNRIGDIVMFLDRVYDVAKSSP